MEFHSNHGCLDFERSDGNDFEVDFEGKYDFIKAASDDLEDTVDYGPIYKLIDKRMSQPSNLLEKVALDLEESISREFPQFEEFTLAIRKSAPPVGGQVQWAQVKIVHNKK